MDSKARQDAGAKSPANSCPSDRRLRISYLFTTFPLLSERFLQREIEAMQDLGVELELFSLIGGEAEFRGIPVKRFRCWRWLGLPWAFSCEYARSPKVFHEMVHDLRRGRPAGRINFWENLLGFVFAVAWARDFRRTPRNHLHAVWATAPAAAAILLQRINGTHFTMGAHAYDVFRDGGDWLLEKKLAAARLIHTSTEATREELLRRNAPKERVVVVRRGLNYFPVMNPVRPICRDEPIRLLSVGRLIEKKGFESLIRICSILRANSLPFECRIIGAGPLRRKLDRFARSLDVTNCIQFLGAQPHEKVEEGYRWADLFCFTGRIADNNDRDGLPNVIAEAMAYGLPVLSAPVSGTVEAIRHEISGYLLDPERPDEWVAAIDRLRKSEDLRASFQQQGRAWVEVNFDARKNAKQLLEALRLSAG